MTRSAQDEEQLWQQQRTGVDGRRAVAGLHVLWHRAASKAGPSHGDSDARLQNMSNKESPNFAVIMLAKRNLDSNEAIGSKPIVQQGWYKKVLFYHFKSSKK